MSSINNNLLSLLENTNDTTKEKKISNSPNPMRKLW